MDEEIGKTVNLLKQAIRELETKTTASTSSTTNSTTNSRGEGSSNVAELRRLFSPYQRPFKSKAGNKLTCTKYSHKYICLASQSQDFVPNKDEKIMLSNGGLGEKRINMDKTPSAEYFRDNIYSTYPKLKDGGGYELLRTSSRSCLDLIHPPNQGYNSEYLADSCALGQSTIFIRPLQKDLDLSVENNLEPSDDCLQEICIQCGKLFPIILLKGHIEEVHENIDLPVIKKKLKDAPICQYTHCSDSKSKDQEMEEKISETYKKEMTQCPICLNMFDKDMIEFHSSLCEEKPLPLLELPPNERPRVIPIYSTLAEHLSSLKNTIFTDVKKFNISVLRKKFLKTAMENLIDADYDKISNVIFIGEEGVDVGGLTREFFSMLFQETPVFENGAFSIDYNLMDSEYFKYIGKASAYSIIQGHQGPSCLSVHLVQYILSNIAPHAEDIPEKVLPHNVSQAIKEITEAEDDFINLSINHSDILETSGYKKALNRTTKHQATAALKNHFGFNRYLPQMLQFIEGLKLHGVYEVLKSFPKDSETLFTKPTVTSSEVIDFFQPSFSVVEDEKVDEEVVVYNLHSFLKKLERGKIESNFINLVALDEGVKKTISLEDFLRATTGSPTLVRDLPQGLLLFDHLSEKCSTVNTCAPSITINSVKKNTDYDFFQKAMIDIIVCSQEFGIA